jgi:nucleotide sugar dehydrogenase
LVYGGKEMEFNNIYEGLISGQDKLALVGLGYVGMPIAVEFAKHVPVIGFDINKKRVNEYKNGIDSTNEVGEEIKKTTVDFTDDPNRLQESRFIIVAVPTPVNDDNTPDLAPVRGASKTVGQNIKPGTIVVFESTVYPGVTEDICIPIIEKESGLKCGVDWKIGYSPERINPGDRVHTLTSIRKIVSGMDEETATEIKKIYDIVIKAGTVPVSTIKTAEAVKVVENSQRDINIAFVNEVAMICDKMGIDTDEVIYGMNSKWNALGFKPGLVGGHCIGVDPYYLTNAAERLGYHSQIILNGRKVNDSMGGFVADAAIKEMIEAGLAPKKATVVVLGITFKENCPDTRNSKVVDIINRLKEYDINPIVTDSWADVEVAKKEYGVDVVPFDSIPKADCVIVAVGHSDYRNMSMMQLKDLFKDGTPDEEKVLIDVKSLYRMDELKASGMRYWRL